MAMTQRESFPVCLFDKGWLDNCYHTLHRIGLFSWTHFQWHVKIMNLLCKGPSEGYLLFFLPKSQHKWLYLWAQRSLFMRKQESLSLYFSHTPLFSKDRASYVPGWPQAIAKDGHKLLSLCSRLLVVGVRSRPPEAESVANISMMKPMDAGNQPILKKVGKDFPLDAWEGVLPEDTLTSDFQPAEQ